MLDIAKHKYILLSLKMTGDDNGMTQFNRVSVIWQDLMGTESIPTLYLPIDQYQSL